MCPECGAPWERVVEKGEPSEEQKRACGADSAGGYSGQATKDYGSARAEDPSAVKAPPCGGRKGTTPNHTVGWRPTCEHDADPVPATVLDPFAGSGTTLAVAEKLGRHGVGIELNPEYADMAERRIALAAQCRDTGDLWGGTR